VESTSRRMAKTVVQTQKQWFKHRLHGQYLGDQKKLAAVLISRFHVGVVIFGLNERGIDQTQQKQAADEYG
jgi:hypothetical protein